MRGTELSSVESPAAGRVAVAVQSSPRSTAMPATAAEAAVAKASASETRGS